MIKTSSKNIFFKVYCISFRNGLLYIYPNKSWKKSYTAEHEKMNYHKQIKEWKRGKECNSSTISSEINWSWKIKKWSSDEKNDRK